MAKLLPLTLAIACNAELILDGGDNGWSQWYRSVDGVMGGRSSISVQRDGNVLAASGEIVTAGGGFAGTRHAVGKGVAVVRRVLGNASFVGAPAVFGASENHAYLPLRARMRISWLSSS